MAVPHPVTLQGRRVLLEALSPEHFADLLAIGAAYSDEFRLTSTPTTQAEADEYFSYALRGRDAGDSYPFTVRLAETGEVIGSSRFNALDFTNRNTQLGWTWFRPDQYGTATNVESKLLMLTFAFEELQLARVSIRTDVDNHRSRRAILALGATEEGILRRHMLRKDGGLRDTVVYSIIDTEWPAVKAHNQERLERRLQAG